MKKRFSKRIVILLALCFLSLVYVINVRHNYSYLLESTNNTSISGVVLLYELYSGREFIIFNFLLLLLIPFVSHMETCIHNITGFDQMIIVRLGRKKYYRMCIMQSIQNIWYFPIIINLFLLFSIHVFIPVCGLNVKEYGTYFFNRDLVNIIFVTLMQSIGWSMLNVLCFIFSQIIKNKYLYLFSLIVFSVAITLFVALFGNLFPVNYFLSVFTPFTILTGGLMALWYIPHGSIMVMVVVLSNILLACFCYIFTKKLEGGINSYEKLFENIFVKQK